MAETVALTEASPLEEAGERVTQSGATALHATFETTLRVNSSEAAEAASTEEGSTERAGSTGSTTGAAGCETETFTVFEPSYVNTISPLRSLGSTLAETVTTTEALPSPFAGLSVTQSGPLAVQETLDETFRVVSYALHEVAATDSGLTERAASGSLSLQEKRIPTERKRAIAEQILLFFIRYI